MSIIYNLCWELACMKLGSRGKYQPMQYCWVHTSQLIGYLVHTCHLPIDIQQIYCSTQTGQHSHLQHSCCPVWVLQPIHNLQCVKLQRYQSYNPNFKTDEEKKEEVSPLHCGILCWHGERDHTLLLLYPSVDVSHDREDGRSRWRSSSPGDHGWLWQWWVEWLKLFLFSCESCIT